MAHFIRILCKTKTSFLGVGIFSVNKYPTVHRLTPVTLDWLLLLVIFDWTQIFTPYFRIVSDPFEIIHDPPPYLVWVEEMYCLGIVL